MFKKATLPGPQNPLKAQVNCANCGTPMTATGDNYVCPVNDERGPDHCPTMPAGIGRLTIQVATRLLKRVMNDSAIAALTADVQQASSEISRTQEKRLRRSESSIEELDALKARVLQPVEQNLATYQEVAEEVHRINVAKTGLAYESQVAQEEIDKLAFIGDPDGLREDARDMAAHLEDADPEEVRGLLNPFVREIRVGPKSAEVIYSHPLPDEQNRATVASDHIALNP